MSKNDKEMTINELMDFRRSQWKPKSGSGKTRGNREKAKGESWLKFRNKTALK